MLVKNKWMPIKFLSIQQFQERKRERERDAAKREREIRKRERIDNSIKA